MKKNITLFLTFLMMSIYSIALSKPTPDDAPPDFAPEGGGPPPPPPAPIDGYITVFLILTIVLAFVFFYNYKKKQNQYI